MNTARRNFVASGIAAAMGTMLTGTTPGQTVLGKMLSTVAEKKKFNILYITADDLNTRLGCYGDTQAYTPKIDAFAKEAVLFERCFCGVSLCTPSRSSIFASIRPESSNYYLISDVWTDKLPNVVSLGRHLRNNGYATISIGKILDPRAGTCDEPWGPPTGKNPNPDITYYDTVQKYGLWKGSGTALDALTKLKDTTDPWFLAVGDSNPHCPWTPTGEYLTRWDRSKINVLGVGVKVSSIECNDDTAYPAGFFSGTTLTEAEARELTCRYYGEVTQFDTLVGDILAKVKELGMWDNTIIIVWCGDNSHSIGENNSWKKNTCSNADTWVPLIMRVPGLTTSNTRTSGMVEVFDMYPTLVDLCGLPLPTHQMQGFSFAPLLSQPNLTWKKAVFSSSKASATAVLNKSVKTKDYRLILIGTTPYLYDHRTDWAENTNIAAQHPDIVAQLTAMMNTAGWEAAKPDITSANLPSHKQIAPEKSISVESLGNKTIRLQLSGHAALGHAEIFDVRGRIIWQADIVNGHASRTLHMPSSGYYSLRFFQSGFPSGSRTWFVVP